MAAGIVRIALKKYQRYNKHVADSFTCHSLRDGGGIM